jgi:hypothetical protein
MIGTYPRSVISVWVIQWDFRERHHGFLSSGFIRVRYAMYFGICPTRRGHCVRFLNEWLDFYLSDVSGRVYR